VLEAFVAFYQANRRRIEPRERIAPRPDPATGSGRSRRAGLLVAADDFDVAGAFQFADRMTE
jgi:hypothetical protein